MYELLTNARFFTGRTDSPAARLLTCQGRVIALDPLDADIPPAAKRTDLGGVWALPGLIDAHLHLFWIGEQLHRYADLSPAKSISELLDLLTAHARSREGWVLGRGFDQEKLQERRFPTRDELDRALPHRPVIITRICGHAGVASTLASPQSSNPSGLFLEGQLWSLLGTVPPMTDSELETAAMLAMDLVASRGFVGIGTMLEEPRQFAALARLRQQGPLPLHVTAHFPGAAVADFHQVGLLTGVGDEYLRLGAAKFFSDGTLGARTALLSQPYSDAPDESGLELIPRADLLTRFRDAHDKGFQIAVHAIGDLALRHCIDALEPLCNPHNPRRHRIEHVSLCPDDQLNRLARLGILACVQPQFATSDTWMRDRLGDRVAWAYRFSRLIESGVELSLSSDAPVESPDPALCIAAALTSSRWHDEPPLTLDQTLTAYTLHAARAGGMDPFLGSFTPGKLARMTLVRSSDLRPCPQDWTRLPFSAR